MIFLLGMVGALLNLTPVAHGQQAESLRVPGFTAYSEPDAAALEFSGAGGVTGWKDEKESLAWYGKLNAVGRLDVAVSLRLPKGEQAHYRLTVAGQTRTAQGAGNGQEPISVDFGSVRIAKPGYYRFALQPLAKTGGSFGDVEALRLAGAAAANAHFNLTERRNAASVHLGYPTARDANITWFYNEVTVKTDPLWSYYMACGFQRGYFGIQVNSPTERRIIFSVWDSGNEGVDRNKVAAENRVQLLAKGQDVIASDFGNEGTGGHSHLIYSWKTGHTYRFLVSAEPDATHTIYTGYFFFPETRAWGLIARFRAPKDGGWLRGLYSFNEDFAGENGQLRRLGIFGPAWIKTADGVWTELIGARFTHDGHGKENRKDYGAGVVNGRFYLSNGGFVGNKIRYGDTLQRPHARRPPTDIMLPSTP